MPNFVLTVTDDPEQLVLATVLDLETIKVVSDTAKVVVQAEGLQGPPGPGNLYVGPTPPVNAPADAVWIDTSGL